jgi:hypothetical protein
LLGLGGTSCASGRLLLKQLAPLLTQFLFGLARSQAFRTTGLSLTHFLCARFMMTLVSTSLFELLLDLIREIARSVQGLAVTLDLLHLVVAELVSDRMALVLLRRLLWRLLLLWLFSHKIKISEGERA